MSDSSPKLTIPPGCIEGIDIKTLKWELKYLEPFGRCLLAKEEIEEGEILFEDQSVITGPKQNSEIMCLGCYKQLYLSSFNSCSKCGWPVCNSKCESKGYHPLECSAFEASGYKFSLEDFTDENPLYESILPLRCLLLEDTDKKKWETLMAMESHDSLRRGSELWQIAQKNVCDFLREKIKLKKDDARIHTVTGILDVNCHEIRSNIPNTKDEYRVRGIYPLCAMMSHNCSSNTHHTIMDDEHMLVIASRTIKKGEQITGTYTHLLSGTIERRKHLKYGKFFDCICDRCKDPTENGTYFSALKCSKPQCGGNVLPKNPVHPNNTPDFECEQCGFEVQSKVVTRITNMIYLELQQASESDPKDLEAIFKKYKGVLHPNHYHLIGIKHSLGQMYGRVEGYLIGDLSPQHMERKIECCRDLLKVLEKIDPGISRLRGLTLYELHAPILLRANRAFQNKSITKTDFLETLNECLKYLKSSINCLQFEPLSSFEGEICKIARGSASELYKWIKTVEGLPVSRFLPPEDTQKNSIEQDLTLESLLRTIEEY